MGYRGGGGAPSWVYKNQMSTLQSSHYSEVRQLEEKIKQLEKENSELKRKIDDLEKEINRYRSK